MTTKELNELGKLRMLWLLKKATKKQMLRCMELSRTEEFEAKQLKEQS